MPDVTQETPVPVEENLLRALTDMYYQTQKLRIAIGNRIWAADNETDATNAPEHETLDTLFNHFVEAEKLINGQMQLGLVGHPAWGWLQQVKGIGPNLATQLLGLIADIEKAPSISSLWRFAGYGVVDGEAEKLVKGETAHFNRKLKTVMWKIGTSFLKSKSPYNRLYYEAKEYYATAHPDWTPIHIHRCSMRKMNKIFLQHLWVKWREAEGLEVSKPWVLEHGGHVHYISAEDILGATDES
jgi:hypothetical protein